jgi:hypothetical protein
MFQMSSDVRADEDPYVHSERFRRVSEGLASVCEEYCGMPDETPVDDSVHGLPYIRVTPEEAAALKTVGVQEGLLMPTTEAPSRAESILQDVTEALAYAEERIGKLREANHRLVLLMEEMVEGYEDADLNWYLRKAKDLQDGNTAG